MDFTELKNKMKEFKKQYQADGQKMFQEYLKELWATLPEGITSFGFIAYTPYFNDGDTCRYGVYADEPDINGEHYWDLEKEDQEKFDDAAEKIASFIHSVPKEIIEAMFGDHVRITIYRDGRTETSDYNHD
jgi:hypothetical protein